MAVREVIPGRSKSKDGGEASSGCQHAVTINVLPRLIATRYYLTCFCFIEEDEAKCEPAILVMLYFCADRP